MTIVHILNFFYPDYAAGTENYVLNLAKQQQQNKHQVFVVRPNYWQRENYVYENIPIKFYDEEAHVTKEVFLGLKPSKGVDNLKNLLYEINPEIIHFHELGNGNGISYSHFQASYQLNKKIFFTPHLSTLTCANGTLFFKKKFACDGKINLYKCTYCCISDKTKSNFIAKALAKTSIAYYKTFEKSKKQISNLPMQIERKKNELEKMEENVFSFLSLTNWYASVLKHNYVSEKKIKVIQQASVINYFEKTNTKNKPTIHNLKLLYVGRIAEEKGIHLIIDAIENLAFPVEVNIIGKVTNENYFNQLKLTATQKKLNINWQGAKTSVQVLEAMQQHHALLLPSLFSEMSPLVIQEAFAVGLPVIASNAAGNAEQIVEDYNGLLFQFGNTEDFKHKIEYFYHHQQQFSNFNYTNRTFENIYQEVMDIYNS